jgi:hypothetical protein
MSRKESPGPEDKGTKKDGDSSPQQLYQQLLTCMRGTWRSLAVVPAQPGLSARLVADALVDVSSLVRGASAKLFSGEGLELAGASKVIVDMMTHVESGGLAIVVLDNVVRKQSGIPIAMAADATLLVVHLGLASTDNAKKTVELIGADKFIGAVTLEQGKA